VGPRYLRVILENAECEKVYRTEYRDISDALACIREFLEKVYNQKRLHSALAYVRPSNSTATCWRKRKPLSGILPYEFSEA
jgi:hypothetical protein